MINKLRFAIIGLLGFSTACSTARKNQKSSDDEPQVTTEEVRPTIQVMYGVRRPQPLPADDNVKVEEGKIERLDPTNGSGSIENSDNANAGK